MLCILLRALLVGALSHQIVQVHTLEELVRNTEADSKASDTKKEDREKKMKKEEEEVETGSEGEERFPLTTSLASMELFSPATTITGPPTKSGRLV